MGTIKLAYGNGYRQYEEKVTNNNDNDYYDIVGVQCYKCQFQQGCNIIMPKQSMG